MFVFLLRSIFFSAFGARESIELKGPFFWNVSKKPTTSFLKTTAPRGSSASDPSGSDAEGSEATRGPQIGGAHRASAVREFYPVEIGLFDPFEREQKERRGKARVGVLRL